MPSVYFSFKIMCLPYFFLMFSLLLKELIFIFLFVVTTAGIAPCDGPKSSIVHI